MIGLLLTLLILTPLFGLDPIVGSLIEVAFEGEHGTAAGMAQTFTNLDFPEGGDLAIGLATVGMVTGVIFNAKSADRSANSQLWLYWTGGCNRLAHSPGTHVY